MIRALVFDCDGVLADNEPLHRRALTEALRPEGIPVDGARYAAILGMPDRASVEDCLAAAGRPVDPAVVDRVCAAKAEHYRRAVEAGIPPVPGAAEFLKRGAERLPVAVASGGLLPEVELVLAGLGVRDRVSVLVTAGDAAKGKPDPEPFLVALARLNALSPAPGPPLAPGECMVFEDSEHGVRAALAAGMRCIGITTSHSGDRLRDADLVAPHFRALDLDRLLQMFGRSRR